MVRGIAYMWLMLGILCAGMAEARDRPKVQLGSFQHYGATRTYYYFIPPHLNDATNVPVVLALHGGGRADGKDIAEQWGLVELARQEGFIAVFPNGMDAQWNDGRGVTFRRSSNSDTDDVGFLQRVITRFIRYHGADPDRIYMAGASNGGMMTLRMACEHPEMLAAIVPMLASLPENLYRECSPEKPVPMLMMNGTDDKVVPFDGGPIRLFGRDYGTIMPVRTTLDIWVHRNACERTPYIVPLEEYKPSREAEGIMTELYTDCASGKAVMLYLFEGAGHYIPSLRRRKSWFKGDSEANFSAATEIWEFVKHYKR